MRDFDPDPTTSKPVDGAGFERLSPGKRVTDKGPGLAQLVHKRADRHAMMTLDYSSWLRDGETVTGCRAYADPEGLPIPVLQYSNTLVNVTFGESPAGQQFMVKLAILTSTDRVRRVSVAVRSETDAFIDNLRYSELSPLPIILPPQASIFPTDVYFDPDAGSTPVQPEQKRAELSVSLSSLQFPDTAVGMQSNDQSITLSSTGNDTLNIQGISVTGQFVLRGVYPPTLAPGASVSVSVAFKPESEGGRVGNVRILTNALDSPANITLSGTALPEGSGNTPQIRVTPARLAFGEVVNGTVGTYKDLEIANPGSGMLRISNIGLTGPFLRDGTVENVPAGESRILKVAFAPEALGEVAGTLSINSNAAPATVQVGMTGTGIVLPAKPAFAVVSPSPLQFPQQLVGATRTLELTIANTGESDLESLTVASNVAQITIGTLPLSIVAGTSIKVQVTYTASAEGSHTGAITINGIAANTPLTVPVSGRSVEPTTITWLTAHGRQLKDAEGKVTRLRSCNWYGTESIRLPAGLWSKPYKSITVAGELKEGVLDTIAGMGFNSIRLPICQDVTFPGHKPNTSGIGWDTTFVNPQLNPDLFVPGEDPFASPQPVLTAIEIMDKIIGHCRELGMRVVLDMHCAAPNTDNITGLAGKWYTTAAPGDPGETAGAEGEPRNEQQMLDAWVFLAERYKDDPVVCGFDLANEPFNSSWDNDAITGIAAFYERCATAIQAVNPRALIICEGIGNQVKNDTVGTWWGGNLSFAKDRPVSIPVQNKLVYSPHEYGSYQAGTFSQPWFQDPTFPANMPALWRKQWGGIAEDDIAPLWIGEFGASLRAKGTYTLAFVELDKKWLKTLCTYCDLYDINFAYWSINPPGEPTGILEMEAGVWGDPMPEKIAELAQFLHPTEDDSAFVVTEAGIYVIAENGEQIIVEG